MDSKYIDRLVKGKCPDCGALFTDDPKRPKILVCMKGCGYEIDVDSYFDFVEEFTPTTPYQETDPDENLKGLNEL